MAPAICDGEVLHVAPVRSQDLTAGDIVLFREGTRFKAHRLTHVAGQVFLTKGDSSVEADRPVSPDDILGKVAAKEVLVKGRVRVVKMDGLVGRAKYFARVARMRAAVLRQCLRKPLLVAFKSSKPICSVLFLLLSLTVLSPVLRAQVAFDTVTSTSAQVTGATPQLSFTHTAGGTNRVVVVGVSINIGNSTATTVTGVTYNAVAMTRAGFHNDAGNTRRVEMWYLIAPATAANAPVVVSLSALGAVTVGAAAGAVSFTGADQNAPIRSFASAHGATGTVASVDVPSAVNDLVLDTMAAGGNRTVTFGTTQTSRWNLSTGAATATDVRGTGSTRAGAQIVPMSETLSGTSNWSVGAVSVRPSQADVGVSTVPTSSFSPGNLTYTVTVTNNGPSPASGISLTDTLVAGLTFVSATPSQGSCSGTTTITCAIGALASGASATVTIVATPAAIGTYPNTASVTSTSTAPDGNVGNDSYTAVAYSESNACASPSGNGPGGTLTGIVNTYFPGTASVASGAKSITLGTGRGAAIPTPIAINDLLLVIQMQDAAINSTNSIVYGDGADGSGFTNLNNAGVYEFVIATNAVTAAGGTLNFTGAGTGGGLLYSYTNAAATTTQGQRRFQVVRVPQYSTATLSSTLTAAAWNGTSGGILSIDVASTLTLNSATVSVNGLGFRGGAGMQLNGSTGANTDYAFPAPAAYTGAAVAGDHGAKGEGIAGTPRWVQSGVSFLDTGAEGYPTTTGSMARGAPANGGGGGTDGSPAANNQNAGGGGGGNGGQGGSGGNAWNGNLSTGGLGGATFPSAVSRIVLGGGGGAGSRNDSPGDNQASAGAAGGGIVIIRAGTMTGTATITANGAAAYNGTANDAGGGGGSGGTIAITSLAGGEGGLTLSAQGGRGGDAWNTQAFTLADRHGPGGGGGGGAIFVSAAPASTNIAGGAAGVTLNPGVPYGAGPGSAGTVVTSATLPPPQPGLQSGAQCVADLTIAKTHSGNFVRGSTGVYSITVSNDAIGPSASSVGLVTVSDTLPAGLTPTIASGTGWGCGIVGQIVTCTRATSLGPSSSFPVISVTVSVAQGAASSVTNTATVSGGGELVTTNDTANDLTTIVSSADIQITKTAAPNPVKQGAALAFTLTVTNNGPSNATNVTATDVLSGSVTFVSASSTQGSCANASGTVTCTIGSMNSGATVTATINVTAGAPTRFTNTATVTATEPDPTPANNTSSVTVTIVFPTQVRLETFTAASRSDGTHLTWKTSSEHSNLGFNVYREENGQRKPLNPSLVAGSALMVRGSLPQHTAKTYAWIDRSPGSAVYWLEDVDLDGVHTWHGPVAAQGTAPAADAPKAKTLAEFNNSVAEGPAFSSRMVEQTAVPATGNSGQREKQFDLAAHPAVKIGVQHEGWNRVTQPELVAAGLNPAVDPRMLQLFAEGVEQAIRITGSTSGAGGFGPQAAIEFYGTGIDTAFSDTRTYWLALGDKPGLRIGRWDGTGDGGSVPTSFLQTVELKQRTTYFAALLRPGTDNFFGALVSSTPVDQLLTATNTSSASVVQPTLQIVLQGVTEGVSHSVLVSVNGASLGDVSFDGQDEGKTTIQLPRDLLQEGVNTVTLTAQGGDNDLALVDYIRLTYAHTYTVEADALRFTATGGDHVTLGGFTAKPARLLDITNPATPLEIVPKITSTGGSFTLDALIPNMQPGKHTLLAVAEDQFSGAASLLANQPSSWHSAQPGADLAIVSHGDFVDALKPLVQLRRGQGTQVALANVEDLYDEFSFGEKDPSALREFLRTAGARWQRKPGYLLLVGDASFDPRDYLGLGSFDFVPTRIVPTAELKTASDDWFSDFSNTGFAKLSTGRLPARTAAGAQALVSKIVGYERSQNAAGWTNQVLLVADKDDDVANFTQQAQAIQALLPGSMVVNDVFATNLDANTARQQIVDAINNGALLVNYNGHGSVEIWSGEDLMDDTIAASLTNRGKLPVFIAMNCLNGFFHDLYTQSLAEALLFSPNGGAVAVWASSGLTSADPQFQMDQNVVGLLFGQTAITLGDATRTAKASISDSDVRRTFILFGDPMLQIKRPMLTTRPPALPGHAH